MIKTFGYLPPTKKNAFTYNTDDTGNISEDIHNRLNALELRSESPSHNNHKRYSSVSQAELSDRLLGKLSLRLKECENNVQKISLQLSSESSPLSASLGKDLRGDLKLLGKNTSKACRTLSAGIGDVQTATLQMYRWADSVHKAFETVSYKLEYPTNICPKIRMSLKHSATTEDDAGAL